MKHRGSKTGGLNLGESNTGESSRSGEADAPVPELLEPKIASTIFAGGVHHFERIGSTNAAAMQAGAERWAAGEAANDGATAAEDGGTRRGEVWIAEEQTAGRGRGGHRWESRARDGIYLSALLRPRLSPADAIVLSLAAGLAVVDAVHEVTGLWSDLRWPNDVLLGDKKFCGILCELSSGITRQNAEEMARVRFVVVGMGLNANHEGFPAELAPIATSLRMELGRTVSRVELVAALLRALDREQASLEGGGSAARDRILRRFEQHSTYCRGAEVTVEEDGGYQGTTRGLDELGFLRVETGQGMRTVLSGGVRKR